MPPSFFTAKALPKKEDVYPGGKAPRKGKAKILLNRVEPRSLTEKKLNNLEKMRAEADVRLGVDGRRILLDSSRDPTDLSSQRDTVIEKQARIIIAQEEMEKYRMARDKWNEARWKVVLLDEINEYLNLVEVTTKKVTHLYGPPVVGEDAKLTNLAIPAIDPREATMKLLWNLVQQQALVDTVQRVRGWPTKALTEAMTGSIRSICGWLGSVNRNSCVYWLWHNFPEKVEHSRADILRWVASHGKSAGALCPAFFIPKDPSLDRSFSIPRGFVPTIANELVGSLPYWKRHIEEVWFESGAQQVLNRVLSTQFERLIVEPYKSLYPKDQQKPILVIIDSFDQCKSAEMDQILGTIEYSRERLPICFLISSKRTGTAKRRFDSLKAWDCLVEGECTVEEESEEESKGEEGSEEESKGEEGLGEESKGKEKLGEESKGEEGSEEESKGEEGSGEESKGKQKLGADSKGQGELEEDPTTPRQATFRTNS